MRQFFSLFFLLFLFSFSSTAVFAHAGHDHIKIKEYKVITSQEPLSPFVGEKVKVTFAVNDTNDKPVKDLSGEFVINKTVVQQFTNQTTTQEEKEIYKTSGTTDQEGVTAIEYTFPEEGLYNVAFVWGADKEKERASMQIFTRDPTSYFLPQELFKRIWLFIVIALAGIAVGAAGTFILVTTSLHKKK